MVYESGQSSIDGNNHDKRQKHSPNFIPEDINVIQFISKFANNYTGMIKEEHWPSHLLNHLNSQYPTSIPISHLSNQFHTSMESTSQHIHGFQNLNQPPMWDVNHIPMMYSAFDNSGSSMNMGYNGCNSASSNISNLQYFVGSSIKNVGSTNIFSGGMNLMCPLDVNQADVEIDTSYDGRIVPPGSFFHSITSSSAANFHQGQSLYSNCVLPSKCNAQRSNFGTYLRPQVQTSVPNQSNKRAYELPVQSDNQSSHQSNRFKIPRLNLWKPVQSQPLVADHHGRHNCYGLNCKFCTPTEKQTYDFLEPTSNESWVGSGTLTEVLLSFLNRSNGDRFSQESSALQQPALEPSEDVSVVKPKPLTMDSCPEVSNIIAEDIIESNQILKGSEENIDTTNDELKEASDLSFEEFSTWLNQQHVPLPLPDLEPIEDVSITTENMIENNQISEGNIDTMNDEFKEPPEVCFEEKTSDGNEESSKVGPKLICGFNSPSDDYESVLESMQPTTSIVRESSENKKTMITSFDNVSGSGSGKIKKPSASLADYFSASQITEHLSSLINHNNKEKLRSTTQSVGQNPCQLCSMYKLPLAPAPIYCSSCDSQIKQNAGYYRSSDENTNTQHCFCKKCFTGSRKAINLIRGGSISKSNLRQAKNNEEREDSWVQCDRCQLWQHRICGLYNNERDEEGKAEYICPKCHLKEIENENAVPAVKTFLGAKDLPRTNLSDHIEQRLFRRMKQEREEAAKFYGTTMENVPEAEGLIVRVVVSVDKELEVKQQFRNIFQGEDYPEKIVYRSKLILLFQKIGGVDLCLFGMYVQEYGSECDGPNKRCIYISYLDSVKYFQPERKTSSGESLRTFVYHEILIGYLEYCKKRGFATCYIWACPPDGNDYIFYCHPKTQKTPKENKLRQWYKSMLRKAVKDGVVVEHTNLYDQFFVPTNHGNAKITAAHLPYFDGNYWSPVAESIGKKLEEDKKRWGGLRGKSPSKRTKDNPTKDALVMQNLGEDILPKKENFMIVRLQSVCTCCNEVILSGSRWSCNNCNKIHLCSRCFDDGKLLSPSRMHTCHSGKNCLLSEDVLRDVPVDTKDKDDVLVNKFFADRDDFLYKCQKSQYQFDTIGHAKYSSMMILYHFTTASFSI